MAKPTYQHHYDHLTGEYLDTTLCEMSLDNTPQMAAFATLRVRPPVGPNQVAVFRDDADNVPVLESAGSWKAMLDFRGTKYWLADGTEMEITDLGVAIPPGALREKPAPTPANLLKGYGSQVDLILNKLATAWGYTGFESALPWVMSHNPKYVTEAQSLMDYGTSCFSILDEMADGKREVPTDLEAFLATLPPQPVRPVLK